MTNILIEGDHIPTYDMTVIAFERFSKFLPINVRAVLSRHIAIKDLKWCDIYVCVRGNNPLSAYLSKQAKKYGCRVILMLDDDLLSYKSKEHSLYRSICMKSLIKIIKISECIITPSNYLGKKYGKQFCKKYVVLDTPVAETDIKNNWYKSNQIRLIYAASHMGGFQHLILPIINELYKRYKDKISLTIIGPRINLEYIEMPITLINSMPYQEYREYMNTHSFDIGFAPLLETEMTKSKYYNKFLEYSTQGICGLYSDCLPYTAIIRDTKNGLLVQNNLESWLSAICKLIDNTELRNKCINEAQSELITKFSIQSVTQSLSIEIPWLTTFKSDPDFEIRSLIKMPTYILFLIQELSRRLLKIFA